MLKQLSCLGAIAMLVACGGGQNETSEAERARDGVDVSVEQPASAAAWVVDREASSIGFLATQNGNEFEGAFGRWDASIVLDLEDPASEGAFFARIDLASADAGNTERNGSLPTKDWFHVAMFPVSEFSSSSIAATGQGTYEAQGTLSIKGISKTVVMPFTVTVDETGRASADGSVMLDRSDFKVGEGQFATGEWVGLAVEVLLHIEATPAG
ncbi:MAG: YceI family protein [Pseudomonadota bacterium]